MVGFRPYCEEPDPEFERSVTNEANYGATNAGNPDHQVRLNFNSFDETPVYAHEALDKVLKHTNPSINQLLFIGTNLYNQYDYQMPIRSIENIQQTPFFGRPTQALFGVNPLDPIPFSWNDPMVFDTTRFGVTHDFAQTKKLQTFS